MKIQINLQVEQSTADLLDAAVFIRNLRSPQELLKPLVEGLATELARDPRISEAASLRAQERKETDNVSPLRKSKKRQR